MLVRSFHTCVALVALFSATLEAGVQSDLSCGFALTTMADVVPDESPETRSGRECPIPEEPAPFDEFDDDDETSTGLSRDLPPPPSAGEVEFGPGEVLAAGDAADPLLRPPIS